ncbi:MAG: hypothetical protein L3J76_03235 [Candidatus Hydrothermae bacterium]|nr:hypothetical protein [Candidatus Hydrothermae bacterium]
MRKIWLVLGLLWGTVLQAQMLPTHVLVPFHGMSTGYLGMLLTDYFGVYGGVAGGAQRSRYFFHGGLLFPRYATIGTMGGGLAFMIHQSEPDVPFDLAIVPGMDVAFWRDVFTLQMLMGIQSGVKVPIEGAPRPLWLTGSFALGPYYSSVNTPGGRVSHTDIQYRFSMGIGYWFTRKLSLLVELYSGRYNDWGFGVAMGFR